MMRGQAPQIFFPRTATVCVLRDILEGRTCRYEAFSAISRQLELTFSFYVIASSTSSKNRDHFGADGDLINSKKQAGLLFKQAAYVRDHLVKRYRVNRKFGIIA